jgi:hypothetical protein
MEAVVTVRAVYSEELIEGWRQTAVRQGLLCLICSEVPSLEHRAAFYDTGVCETCAREQLSAANAPPPSV